MDTYQVVENAELSSTLQKCELFEVLQLESK